MNGASGVLLRRVLWHLHVKEAVKEKIVSQSGSQLAGMASQQFSAWAGLARSASENRWTLNNGFQFSCICRERQSITSAKWNANPHPWLIWLAYANHSVLHPHWPGERILSQESQIRYDPWAESDRLIKGSHQMNELKITSKKKLASLLVTLH